MTKFEDLLPLVTTPIRYVGHEIGAVNKDLNKTDLRVVLCFPDIYEMGISHLGVRLLYHLLNEDPRIGCDRAYAPWTDLEALMRKEGLPLSGHESGMPLKEFDIIGFSLPHELCYSNVLNMLSLAGVPLLASERENGSPRGVGLHWPLVIGGGPCASNPEPIADFFDAFLFGDGEEAILEICSAVLAGRESGRSKKELLKDLAAIEGVYVPSLFEVGYNSDGTISGIKSRLPGYDRVRRRIVADLERAYYPHTSLVPVSDAIHDRVMVEIARGCTRGCRFCHAGIIYRPVRERSPKLIMDLARETLRNTGYEEFSLLSLSAGDYSGIERLLLRLMQEHAGNRIAVSLPSLRVQSLTDKLMDAVAQVRKTGFTFAPEAGTLRLRQVINKTFTDQELLDMAERLFQHGWRNMKLYFMVGLPTETDEDLEAIIDLARRVERVGFAQGFRPQINVSVTAFVPKPHTPFQWEPQIPLPRLKETQERLRRALQRGNIRLKWQDSRLSRLEGVFSRGDRRLSAALLKARELGLHFEGWSEKFDPEGWERVFSETGIDVEFYTTRTRALDEVMPWEHLDPRVSREWMIREREKAYRGEPTPDCRDTGCIDTCGLCDQQELLPRKAEPLPEPASRKIATLEPASDLFFRYRIRYSRKGPARFYGHLEVNRAVVRLVRRAGLPIRYSQGHHPLPKIVFGLVPPVGVESEAEYIELELTERMKAQEVFSRLENAVPEGIRILECREIPLKSPPISAIINQFEYMIAPPADQAGYFNAEAVGDFLSRTEFPIRQQREKGEREVDLRSRVKFMELQPDGSLRLGIRVISGPGVKPGEVVQHVFGLDDDVIKRLRITRTAALFKESRGGNYPGTGERIRRVRPHKKF